MIFNRTQTKLITLLSVEVYDHYLKYLNKSPLMINHIMNSNIVYSGFLPQVMYI